LCISRGDGPKAQLNLLKRHEKDTKVRRPVSSGLARIFPILSWSKTYSRHDAAQDGLAAVIVTIMLIPQSLAYAMLAGMPPEPSSPMRSLAPAACLPWGRWRWCH
jgi:hypothetical protein